MNWAEILSSANQALFYVAIVNLLLVVAIAWQVLMGYRRIVHLSDIAVSCSGPWPKVSIIVPARNEQRDIEVAMQSLLAQDYDNLEIIAINDRSTDRTGEILDALADRDERLKAVHLDDLPPGWLGKNHALQLGADRATGDFLLFMDADVVMDPSTVRRAVAYALAGEVDHLAMTPEICMPSLLLESFVVLFLTYFSVWYQPWKANDPRSKSFVGIGAFNLVRSDVYRATGGHRPIAMRPDDDMMLGKLIKKNGYRQHLVNGLELMHVPWYASLREVVVGLEKNAFAGAGYSVLLTAISSIIALLFNVWPFVAIFLTTGPTQLTYILCVAVLLTMGWILAGHVNVRRLSAFGFPIASALFVYILLRAMLLTLIQGGIRWRDTHYSLAELKANKV